MDRIASVPVTGTPAEEEAFQALYGRWASPVPRELAHLMAGAAFPWWVVGGWALELATQRARPHEDLDVAVRRQDLAALAEHFQDWHLWAAQDGALKPLSRFGSWPDDHEQLWMRKDAESPWVLDVLLTPTEATAAGDMWIFKRDQRIRLPLAVAVRSGPIPYLAPHIGAPVQAERL
ncbi:MAG: hypothetical protein M3P04_12335 [Actinomycetota bacterium]|nr:hypothetical protein [Actinomycetota bacterium]